MEGLAELNSSAGATYRDANGHGFLRLGSVNQRRSVADHGRCVDFIYRNLEHLERVITDAEAGRYETDKLYQLRFTLPM